jgi:lipopolysaccharide/colanic/teichoic acid biosynthesis glycosyltransferase
LDGSGAIRILEEVSGSDEFTGRVGPIEATLLRVVNLAVSLVALTLLLPVILIVGFIIKLDSPGPVLYRQLRVGLNRRNLLDDDDSSGRRVNDLGGRPFSICKFRTMYTNAEIETGPVWATPNDARTTRIGQVLRRTRIDEIPQFWNVLKGEMSVVGPRPERPTFVRHLRREVNGYQLRNRVRPGITGWAQVNQGYDTDLESVRRKVGYDLEYVRRQSLLFDLWIMLKTLPVMINREKE